mmetsp:Transcript_9799/g.21224  ORF Transcript_9799/g.21224 Transcript_9799/m.21224 type:complete len:83 (+) Transcript_9799:1430-1678(+)
MWHWHGGEQQSAIHQSFNTEEHNPSVTDKRQRCFSCLKGEENAVHLLADMLRLFGIQQVRDLALHVPSPIRPFELVGKFDDP